MTRRAAPCRVSPCGATSFAHGGKGGKTPPGVGSDGRPRPQSLHPRTPGIYGGPILAAVGALSDAGGMTTDPATAPLPLFLQNQDGLTGWTKRARLIAQVLISAGGNWRAGPRRRGLHIPRFAQQGKARSFHRSASPTQTRFAGLCVGGRLRRPLWTDRRPPDPHPLPRLVGIRRGCKMVQAKILHRTRAQWPERNQTRNRILRAGNIT